MDRIWMDIAMHLPIEDPDLPTRCQDCPEGGDADACPRLRRALRVLLDQT